jgi:hypothetical protein
LFEGADEPFGRGLIGAPVVGCGEFVPVVAVAPAAPPGPGRKGSATPEGVVTHVPPPTIARTGAGAGGGVAGGGEEAAPGPVDALRAGEVVADVEALFPPNDVVWLTGREPGTAARIVFPI